MDLVSHVRSWTTTLCLSGTLMACASESPAPASVATADVLEQAASNRCSLNNIAPEVLMVDGVDSSEWHGRFDLSEFPRLWEPAEFDEALETFRQAVRARLGTDVDAGALLERQRAILAMSSEWSGEAANATSLLDGRVGVITPISCLEAMIWKWQAARYPMLEHPTEFGAFVLTGHEQVRVYLSSADLVGQRIRRKVTDLVQADISAGWRLLAHIHNHPFLFDRKVGDRMWTVDATKEDVAGALAPSTTDVQFFRSVRDSLNLEEAWVTNGLHTSRFRAREFDLLAAR